MTITNELLDDLEAKAKAAIEDGIEEGFDYDPSIGMTLGETRFACAANPATILALVEYIRSQAAELERCKAGQAVEDGWQLVPVEPTDAMIECDSIKCHCGHQFSGDLLDHVYRQMIAAAPAAPVAVQEPMQEPVQMHHEPHNRAMWHENCPGRRFSSPMKPRGDGSWECGVCGAVGRVTAPPSAEQPNHSGDANEMVWCSCGDGYQANSYDAGFIDGSGMCQNCDAALPARDITAPPAAEQPDSVAVPVETLRRIHRVLDACQKVIWLAGCRPRGYGFDPAYVTEAQARLKEIDALLSGGEA